MALGGPESQKGEIHLALGGSTLSLGSPAEALRLFDLAVQLAPTDTPNNVTVDADVLGRGWAAHALWLLGREDEALARCQDAISVARAGERPFNLAAALAHGSVTHQLRQDVASLTETAEELREICERYDFAYYREWALIMQGWLRPEESGISMARRGIRNLRSEGSLTRMPYWLSLLADLYYRTEQAEDARGTLDAALSSGHARDDVWWLPEVGRMRAAYDDPVAAVARLRSAAVVASSHGSVTLVRRCEEDLRALGAPVSA